MTVAFKHFLFHIMRTIQTISVTKHKLIIDNSFYLILTEICPQTFVLFAVTIHVLLFKSLTNIMCIPIFFSPGQANISTAQKISNITNMYRITGDTWDLFE
eukprot:427262_1